MQKKGKNAYPTTATKYDNDFADNLAGAKVPAKAPASPGPKKPSFEKSKFDNDKGVKEGGKADRARDVKEKSAYKKAGGK